MRPRSDEEFDEDAVEEIDHAMAKRGVHGVLALLNARSPHRFTGIYRFDPPTLRSLHLYDRNNPSLEVGEDTPMRETYCSIVGEQEAAFAVADAMDSARLSEHPARESVRSYQGIPLVNSSNVVVGTLCHFDIVPRPNDDRANVFMAEAAKRLLPELERLKEI